MEKFESEVERILATLGPAAAEAEERRAAEASIEREALLEELARARAEREREMPRLAKLSAAAAAAVEQTRQELGAREQAAEAAQHAERRAGTAFDRRIDGLAARLRAAAPTAVRELRAELEAKRRKLLERDPWVVQVAPGSPALGNVSNSLELGAAIATLGECIRSAEEAACLPDREMHRALGELRERAASAIAAIPGRPPANMKRLRRDRAAALDSLAYDAEQRERDRQEREQKELRAIARRVEEGTWDPDREENQRLAAENDRKSARLLALCEDET